MKSLIATLALFACFQFDAQAMGVIRRLTNEVPPVVITNAPPVVTNAPPVVDAPAFPASWNVTEIKRWDAKWKVMGVHVVPRGLLVSRYDRNSRVESKIEELSGGAWRTVWSGDEETIGGGTVSGNDLYFAAERGSTFIVYDQATGKTRRGAKVPSGYKWNVFTATLNGVPVVGADGPDVTAAVFDMRDGRKLFSSPLDGLIAGMAEAGNVLYLAISDGKQGIVSTAGYQSREFKPSSVAYVPGVGVVAGSQVDGKVRLLEGEKWRVVADLDCSKINRLAYDPARRVLLVSGARPDTFGALDAGLKFWQIKRFNDENKDASGEQFDTDIKPDGAGIVMALANGSGCYVYRATTGAATQPDQPTTPSTEPIEWASIKWYNGDLSGYRQTAKLSASVSSGKVYLKLDRALGGDDVKAVGIVVRDGQPAGGAFDGMGAGKGGSTSFVKGLGNMGLNNDKGGPYWCGTDSALRKKYMPRKGETIFVCVVESKGRVRSTVEAITWP